MRLALVGTLVLWESGRVRPNVWSEHGRSSLLSSLCEVLTSKSHTMKERERRWGGRAKGGLKAWYDSVMFHHHHEETKSEVKMVKTQRK